MLQGRLDPLDVRCNEFRHKAYSEFFADGLSQHTVDDSAMLQRLWDAGHAARSGSYADDARFHDRLAQVTTIYVLTVTQVCKTRTFPCLVSLSLSLFHKGTTRQ